MESTVTSLAIRQLERLRGAAGEGQLRVEYRAEQRGRGRGVARDLALSSGCSSMPGGSSYAAGPDLRSGLGLDDAQRDARAVGLVTHAARQQRSCAPLAILRRALCPADTISPASR